LNIAIILFSGISFLVYGVGCFTSQYLKKEFVRYGFSAQRTKIGFLQICGAGGLFVGLWVPLLGKAGAGGLALMMLVGILVRMKIRDNLRQTTPAILYFLVNTYLLLFAY
jgi:hypothetical protein